MVAERRQRTSSRRLWARLLIATGLAALVAPAVAAAVGAITRQMESVRRLEAQIAGLDVRFGQASAAYDGAHGRLLTARERIRENTAALEKARIEFRLAQTHLALRLSAAYRQPRPSGLEVLLRSRSLSEAISRVDLMERVQRQDGELVSSIGDARDRMRKARVQLLDDHVTAKREAKEARIRLGEVRAVRAARRGALLSARSHLAAMIAAEAARQASAQRLASLRAAQRRVVQRVGSAPSATLPSGGGGDVSSALRRIALCESGGNPAAVSPSGLYRGKYQFDPGTWQRLGGNGTDPAAAPEAEQDRVAGVLYSQRGAAPWPVCGR